ncbi:hypothetical protein [Pseudooceanicola nanhaiensis]|uniref:hypothetical protein n=1 Tax=Pseudooceanicola nanhaiensis TaxID=375761 RepID=UPI0035198690
MATLLQLCESGALEIIDPLEADELSQRTLYATPDFLEWIEQELPIIAHNGLYSDLSPIEQVYAVFVEYVSGEEFTSDRRFKKLSSTPDHHVWEFKTDEIRIFGWAPRKNAFICCFGDSKDRIETQRSYGRYIAQTNFVRDRLDLDEPKSIVGGRHEDVVSNDD